MARSNFSVVVTRVRELTGRVREYLLTSADGSALPEYQAGAHIALHTVSPERGLIVRHYSLMGGSETQDDPPNTYRIAVQRGGDTRGSAHIHRTLEPGVRLELGAPNNNFPLARTHVPVLLLAGGIGITPIFSMARSLARRHRPFKVIYAGRNRDEMAYHDELMQIAGDAATLHYSDKSGQLDLLEILRQQPEDTAVYVCGPRGMIAATHGAGTDLGWSEHRVRSELFGAHQSSETNAFDVKLFKSGKTIHVSKDASILDALNVAGVPVLWDCRRGECGLCPLRVVSSDGALQHNDQYLTDAEKSAGDTMCVCVSRTCGSELILDA